MSGHSYMDTKTRLYSLAQSLELPVDFTETTTTTLFDRPLFIVQAAVGNFRAEGRGPDMKDATTLACLKVLEQLKTRSVNVLMENPCTKKKNGQDHNRPDFCLDKDPNTRLSELLMARKHPPAQYRLLEGKMNGPHWTFSIQVSVDQFNAVGKGSSKKEARRRATTALLQMMGYTVPKEDLVQSALLQTNQEPVSQEKQILQKVNALENQTQNQRPSATAKKSKRSPPAHIPPDFGLGKDPCSRLSELQMIRQEMFPDYRAVAGELVNGSWMFNMEVSLGQYTTSGSGCTKKEAKKRAATALLLMMGYTVPLEDLVLHALPQSNEEPVSQKEEQISQDNQESQTSPKSSERRDISEEMETTETSEQTGLESPETILEEAPFQKEIDADNSEELEKLNSQLLQSPEDVVCPEQTQEFLKTPEEEQIPEALETLENIREEDPSENQKIEEPASAPESTGATQTSPQTVGPVESLVIQALVKKLLKKLPAKSRSNHEAVVEILEKRALDQFRVPDGVYLKPKNVKKLGNAGARDLIYEHGSVSKLLVMALGPESTEFQKDAMKNLNIRLHAFRNRPRTGLARFFSKWDKPMRSAD